MLAWLRSRSRPAHGFSIGRAVKPRDAAQPWGGITLTQAGFGCESGQPIRLLEKASQSGEVDLFSSAEAGLEGLDLALNEAAGRIGGATSGPADFLFHQAVANGQLRIEHHITTGRNPFPLVRIEAGRYRVCQNPPNPGMTRQSWSCSSSGKALMRKWGPVGVLI